MAPSHYRAHTEHRAGDLSRNGALTHWEVVMRKARRGAKCLFGTLATTAVILGSFASPAQARDTGWGPGGVVTNQGASSARDTGWGPG